MRILNDKIYALPDPGKFTIPSMITMPVSSFGIP